MLNAFFIIFLTIIAIRIYDAAVAKHRKRTKFYWEEFTVENSENAHFHNESEEYIFHAGEGAIIIANRVVEQIQLKKIYRIDCYEAHKLIAQRGKLSGRRRRAKIYLTELLPDNNKKAINRMMEKVYEMEAPAKKFVG